MGQVIDMKTGKDLAPKIDDKQALQAGSQLECKRCKAITFKLYADGKVQCGECDANMYNLKIDFIKETAA